MGIGKLSFGNDRNSATWASCNRLAPLCKRTCPEISIVISRYQMPPEVETIMEPDCIADNVRWELVTFVYINPWIIG